MVQKIKKIFQLILGVSFTGLYSGCTSFVATYEDPKTVEIIDTRWNETDERKTAEVLINSLLKAGGWADEFKAKHNKKPALIVDEIENQTSEHINVQLIGRLVRNSLLKSGKVVFVNKQGREKILNEVRYQKNSGNVDPSKAREIGKQLGADLMLTGLVSSQEHMRDNLKTVSYTTVLELTDFESAQIIWADEYQIKKKFKNAEYSR
jgi:penicillin-binding protein activator